MDRLIEIIRRLLLVVIWFVGGGFALLVSDIGNNDQYSQLLFLSTLAQSQHNIMFLNESKRTATLVEVAEDTSRVNLVRYVAAGANSANDWRNFRANKDIGPSRRGCIGTG